MKGASSVNTSLCAKPSTSIIAWKSTQKAPRNGLSVLLKAGTIWYVSGLNCRCLRNTRRTADRDTFSSALARRNDFVGLRTNVSHMFSTALFLTDGHPWLFPVSSNCFIHLMMLWRWGGFLKIWSGNVSEQRQPMKFLRILTHRKLSLAGMSPFWITAPLVTISIIADFSLLPDKTCMVGLSRYIGIFTLHPLQQFKVPCLMSQSFSITLYIQVFRGSYNIKVLGVQLHFYNKKLKLKM